jgi:hypothetical protein
MTTRVMIAVKDTNAASGHIMAGTRLGQHVSAQVVKPPFSHEYWVTDASDVFVTEATADDVRRLLKPNTTKAP